MSDVDTASEARAQAQRLVSELKVSGHLMNLDAGLFCVVQTPAKTSDPALGLPGVRISLPPGVASRPDAVTISAFRDDGWLSSGGDAALVRVVGGPAQILVTVYQAQGTQDAAPNIQVLRLLEAAVGAAASQAVPPLPAMATQAAQQGTATSDAPQVMDMLAHIQGRGDVGGRIGEWLGERGSKRWIEGFALAPLQNVTAADLEYQAVLGRGWMSPWVEGGQFCGSRGMALPILGLRVRLKGDVAEQFDCSYAASFIDGSATGPVGAGEPCESESLAAIEAFVVSIRPKAAHAGISAAPAEADDAPATAAARGRVARKPLKAGKAR